MNTIARAGLYHGSVVFAAIAPTLLSKYALPTLNPIKRAVASSPCNAFRAGRAVRTNSGLSGMLNRRNGSESTDALQEIDQA